MIPTSDILTPGIRAVVFDLDGTLYDKRCLPIRMVCRLWWSLTLLAAERIARRRLRGEWFGSEERFYERFFIEMARCKLFSPAMASTWYFDYYMPTMVKILHRHHRVAAWVKPFIQVCRERKLKIAVYSDYGLTGEKLQAIGLQSDLFDLVCSAPELGGLKPSREVIIRFCDQLGVSPEYCLFVGDREDTDGETAKSVGAKSLIVK